MMLRSRSQTPPNDVVQAKQYRSEPQTINLRKPTMRQFPFGKYLWFCVLATLIVWFSFTNSSEKSRGPKKKETKPFTHAEGSNARNAIDLPEKEDASANNVSQQDCSSNGLFDGSVCHSQRMRQTPVDKYYSEHRKLPLPATVHAILEKPPDNTHSKNILVIGDVHACYTEMLELYQKALLKNDNIPFDYVILTGDMSNKGPDAVKVIRWVRNHAITTTEQQKWLSVRGNNDNTALLAALGSEKQRKKKLHQWITEAEEQETGNDNNRLFDEDVLWMSELPYSITIPKTYFEKSHDTTIVHAGFLPHKDLKKQDAATLVEIRDAIPICEDDAKTVRSYKVKRSSSPETTGCEAPIPWASRWKGPRHVIFGHDADRGLQQHKWATGLDTGAVYGKKMTSIILPERKFVSIETTKGCRSKE